MNEVRLGDYVVASNSKVGDSAERWTCGIVLEIGEIEIVKTGKVTGPQSRLSWLRICRA